MVGIVNQGIDLDIIQKRSWQGPSICPICKEKEKSILHILVGCHFTKYVWSTSKTLIRGVGHWEGESLSQVFKYWYKNPNVKNFRAFHSLWAVKYGDLGMNFSFKKDPSPHFRYTTEYNYSLRISRPCQRKSYRGRLNLWTLMNQNRVVFWRYVIR